MRQSWALKEFSRKATGREMGSFIVSSLDCQSFFMCAICSCSCWFHGVLRLLSFQGLWICRPGGLWGILLFLNLDERVGCVFIRLWECVGCRLWIWGKTGGTGELRMCKISALALGIRESTEEPLYQLISPLTSHSSSPPKWSNISSLPLNSSIIPSNTLRNQKLLHPTLCIKSSPTTTLDTPKRQVGFIVNSHTINVNSSVSSQLKSTSTSNLTFVPSFQLFQLLGIIIISNYPGNWEKGELGRTFAPLLSSKLPLPK